MPLKHVNNTSIECFQGHYFHVSARKDVYFVQISPFLHLVYLLNFSILKILDGRFLVK